MAAVEATSSRPAPEEAALSRRADKEAAPSRRSGIEAAPSCQAARLAAPARGGAGCRRRDALETEAPKAEPGNSISYPPGSSRCQASDGAVSTGTMMPESRRVDCRPWKLHFGTEEDDVHKLQARKKMQNNVCL
jgi:hypothetical protein